MSAPVVARRAGAAGAFTGKSLKLGTAEGAAGGAVVVGVLALIATMAAHKSPKVAAWAAGAGALLGAGVGYYETKKQNP